MNAAEIEKQSVKTGSQRQPTLFSVVRPSYTTGMGDGGQT